MTTLTPKSVPHWHSTQQKAKLPQTIYMILGVQGLVALTSWSSCLKLGAGTSPQDDSIAIALERQEGSPASWSLTQ